jgi:capsular exopolysaccharide synthesis family protein
MALSPISPLVMKSYVIATGVGLFLPLLIFLLAEVFNTRIQSREDINKITSVPVVGGVGHNPENDPLIAYRKPRSAMSESFRALRSNLNYFTGKQEHKIFMITSSVPGEGKSFTTLNLASVFAMAGKKTIIVGADLRKPKLFDALGLNNNIGLSQYLSGMAKMEDVIQGSTIENLFLIAGGPMPPNPSELLLRPAMENLMIELRKQYDYVIVDTPPLTLVTDAFVLAQYTDHTLFVVRQNFTPRAALRSLDEYFTTGKLVNASILFNDLRKSGFGYGYGGYGYGYGYNYGGYGYYGKRRKSSSTEYYQE